MASSIPENYEESISHAHETNYCLTSNCIISFLRDCKIPEVAADKFLSTCLRRLLSSGNQEVKISIVEKVVENVLAVMQSKCGRRLFVEVINRCDALEKENIVKYIASNKHALVQSSRHHDGSYLVQRLVRILKHFDAVVEVTSVLASEVELLMNNINGKYVINDCLVHLDIQKNEPLYKALLSSCVDLATHKVGCRSLYFCIGNMAKPYRYLLLNALADHSVRLAQDPSGNYVLQYVLDLKDATLTHKICSVLRGHYSHLSKVIGGSHVVEKCLKSVGMSAVIQELISDGRNLSQVARNEFGNYVIKTALLETKCTSMELHQDLLKALEPYLETLRLHAFGKNVYNFYMWCYTH